MRARCERHGLAMGPSGCLLCRREQGTAAPLGNPEAPAGASLPASGAAPSAAPVASASLAAAAAPAAPAPFEPFTSAPTMALGNFVEPPAAPATVTDSPSSRRFNIQISPVALLLPVGALALYLCVSLLSGPRTGGEHAAEPLAVVAKAAAAAPEQSAPASAGLPVNDDQAAEAEPPAELPQADLSRLRERAQRKAQQAQQLSDARGRVKVNVYFTERCQHCIEAHGYLVAHGIQAAEHDIDKDARARARLRQLNSKGSLPTIEVDGQVLPGFDSTRLERALDRAAHTRIRRGR